MDSASPSMSKANAAPDLRSEQGRLNTFRCWPHSAAVSPAPLAKAGFYYLGQSDKVRCAFCGATLKSWQHGDDPFTEHKKHYGECLFIQGHDVGNIPLPASSSPATSSISAPSPEPTSSQGLDIGPSEVTGNLRLNPCHPEYQSVDTRLATFVDWSSDLTQRPETLAQAGFFHREGDGDLVRCFCCDGALRNWERGDDPWVEHARWFPRCPYLLQQKGRVFINEILDRYLALQVAEEERLSQNRATSTGPTELVSEPQTLDPGMPSVFREAVEMGFEPERIQTVLQRLISSSGHVPTADQLVNALLGENEPHIGSGEGTVPAVTPVSNSGLSPQVSAAGGASVSTQQSQEGDRTLCKICLDREVAVTFLPCGHLVCCSECAKSVKQCPVCRQTVRASIRTYLC